MKDFKKISAKAFFVLILLTCIVGIATATSLPRTSLAGGDSSFVGFNANLSSGDAPLTVLFTNVSTVANITNVIWNFDDPSSDVANNTNTSNGTVTHTFNTAKNTVGYNVTLTAYNNTTGSIIVGTANEIILVYAQPVANFTTSSSLLNVTFTDNSIVKNPYSNYTINFGDGNISNKTAYTQGFSIVHQYANNGKYITNMTITDLFTNLTFNTTTQSLQLNVINVTSGSNTSANQNVIVNNTSLIQQVNGTITANFSSLNNIGTVPLNVSFIDTSTFVGSNATPDKWFWTFGDADKTPSPQ